MTKFVSSLSLLFVCALLSAQGWDRVFPSIGGEEARAVAPTQDDGFILAGSYSYGQQIYVVKTDADGNRQWARNYPIGVLGICNAVAQDAQGNFFFGGEMDTLVGVFKRRNFFLVKTDVLGKPIWQKNYGTADREVGSDMLLLDDGGILMCGHREQADGSEVILLLRTDADGNVLWFKTVGAPGNKKKIRSITRATNGDFVLCGEIKQSLVSDFNALVARISADGDLVWEKSYNLNSTQGQPGDEFGRRVISVDNGQNFVIAGRTNSTSPGLGGFVMKITSDATNVPIWSTVIPEADLFGLTADRTGGFYVTGAREVSATLGDLILVRLSEAGQIIWEKITGRAGPDQGNAVISDKYGGAVAVGYSEPFVLPTGEQFFYMVRADAEGQVFTSKVKGKVFFDLNNNCAFDANESGLRNWIVKVSNAANTFTYYTISNAAGDYAMELDTGDYTLSLLNANNNWAPCSPLTTFNVPLLFDSVEVNIPIRSLTPCPYNEIDVLTPVLRRCASNVYTVNYCNTGDVVSENTKVIVALDDAFDFQSSSIPVASQSGQEYTFDIGALQPGQCGRFTITAFLSCNSIAGQAYCVKSRITPDAFCQPGGWNGAYVEARGECVGGSVRMYLRNKGVNPTSDVVEFVIADDVVMLVPPSSSFSILDPGQEVQVWSGDADGSTIRIIATQESTFPGLSMPTAAVEGCVAQAGDPFNTGFYTMFPEDDRLPFVEYDCQEVSDTDFNPSIFKRGHPKGYGAERYVDSSTELEYLIYFKNTTNQTVGSVIVRDTLPTVLDPGSVIPGSGSHDFGFSVYGDGIVQFEFANINLQPDAEGWANFRVRPYPNEICGAAISRNKASVNFDFEQTLLTNEVKHTICAFDSFVVVSTLGPEFGGAALRVYPNPAGEFALFDLSDLKSADYGSFQLTCFDLTGRVLTQVRFTDAVLRIPGASLGGGGGVYYRLNDREGRVLSSGMLLIVR